MNDFTIAVIITKDGPEEVWICGEPSDEAKNLGNTWLEKLGRLSKVARALPVQHLA